MTTLAPSRDAPAVTLTGFDHVELWVGNARQAMAYWCRVLGFEPVAWRGPETGTTDHVSFLLAQGAIRIVVTSGLDPDSAVVRHVAVHGDGVRRVAFTVADAAVAARAAVAAGARPRGAVRVDRSAAGEVAVACIDAWGDAEYAFVSRPHGDWFLPGFQPVDADLRAALGAGPEVGLAAIDHVVVNVPTGDLASIVAWHERVLGLRPAAQFSGDVSTPRSALVSTVLTNESGAVTMPVNEPAPGPRRSQIQEFLDAWGGAGVQHMALSTPDIVTAVGHLRERGQGFLAAPADYHDTVRDRVGDLDAPWDDLRALDILVDTDRHGHLLQIFTDLLQVRPTLFLEIIQRAGARGFGAGNFGALFRSMEDAQERRGNL